MHVVQIQSSSCARQTQTSKGQISSQIEFASFLQFFEVRDSRTGYLLPARDGPGALPDGQSCGDAAVAAVAVTWKLRLTFRPGNYIWRFSDGFGVVVRDLGEWRPGFYTEFRRASREHCGLAWGAIFEKVIQSKENTHFLKMGRPKKIKNFKTVIKGDQKIKCISAASIVAKVFRDLYMIKLANKFPQYNNYSE